ncbi:MAG: hypothetical protein NVS2B7_15340 [Herpetosiphon sp.]
MLRRIPVILRVMVLFILAISLVIPGAYAEQQTRRLATRESQLSQAVVAGKSVMLPFVTNGTSSTVPASVFTINNLEVTQAVQTRTNTVPLVANRPAMLRAYVQTAGGLAVNNTTLVVSATRNGTPIVGSPLSAPAHSVFPQSLPSDVGSSVNVPLPAEWLQGDVVLQADLIVGTAAVATASTSLHFNVIPALDVVLVPIDYLDSVSGQLYPGVNVETVSGYLQSMYPVPEVRVTVHPPQPFTGNLRQGQDWVRLVTMINTLKQIENAPASRVYFGQIEIGNAAGEWFHGGIAGIGGVGARFGAGLGEPYIGHVIRHEVGHNLGQSHAPCGTTNGLDPQYPYAAGSIGQYGLDLQKMRVWDPSNTADLMSYCSPSWISDYTYQRMMADQIAHGGGVSPQIFSPGLVVRALLDPAGGAALQPMYTLNDAVLSPPAVGSPYRIELLDADGQSLASYPVSVTQLEQPHGMGQPRASIGAPAALSVVSAIVPAPPGIVSTVRLVRDGNPVAARVLTSNAPRSVPAQMTLRNEVDGAATAPAHVRWQGGSNPALVRASLDNGHSWTTLAVDQTGGDLTVDPRLLPPGAIVEITLADRP